MTHAEKIVLVAGATGHQGGAVARHLLADGWRVRALSRHADSPAALALAGLGAELVVGDLLDRASLDSSVRGAYGVYSVQNLVEGADAEETEGRNLADAAKAAGVEHFVYSSVRGADATAGMPWVVSKHHLEVYLRDTGLPLTIWRPVTFMENFLRDKADLAAGHLRRPMPPDMPWQHIAVDDIGRFVALSFADPDRWIGQTTPIAGDEMTYDELAAIFARALGHPVTYEQTEPAPGMPVVTPPPPGAPALERADIPYLRTLIPDLQTFAHWAAEQDWTPQ